MVSQEGHTLFCALVSPSHRLDLNPVTNGVMIALRPESQDGLSFKELFLLFF